RSLPAPVLHRRRGGGGARRRRRGTRRAPARRVRGAVRVDGRGSGSRRQRGDRAPAIAARRAHGRRRGRAPAVARRRAGARALMNVKLVADVAVVAEGEVLLVRYANTAKYDGQTGWFLPDDFLAHLEHPDDAARRIVREQTG